MARISEVIIRDESISKRPRWARPFAFVFALGFSWLFFSAPTVYAESPGASDPIQGDTAAVQTAQSNAEIQSLAFGQKTEREMTAGQTHTYQVNLNAGQYAYLTFDQNGIDVMVRVSTPDGKLITEVDNPNGTEGLEPVHIVAETTGLYRLDVISLDRSAPPGRYVAKFLELRPATQADNARRDARLAFDEALALTETGTRESLAASIPKYESALSIYRALGDRSEQFTQLISIGISYRELGKFEEAQERFEQSRKFALELGDKFRQARSIELSAQAYRISGEVGQSLRVGAAALELYKATGAEKNQLKMLALIGGGYLTLGEEDKAREYYDRILLLYQSRGDQTGEAQTLHSIGMSYNLEDIPSKAFEYFTKALALWQITKDQRNESLEHTFVANEFARAGKRQEALEHIALALELEKTLTGSRFTAASVLTNVGQTYYKLGEFEKAIPYYQEPLRYWQSIGKKHDEAVALHHIAAALRDLGRLSEARETIEKSISLLEFMRDHAGSPEAQASFVASLFDYYQFYVDLLMRLHTAEPNAGWEIKALAFAEKIKLRNLRELLATGRVDVRQDANPELLEQEQDLNDRITDRLDALTRLLQGKYTDAQRVAAETETDALKDKLSQAQADIRARNPRYSALTEPQPLEVREIQQNVLDSNTVLLEYSLGVEHSYLWAVTPESVQGFQLPPLAEVEALARNVYQLLIARQPVAGLTVAQQREQEVAADAQYQDQASRLSKMLLGPVSAQLGTKRLLIVADGALQYLPFAVLPDPSSAPTPTGQSAKFLLVDHEIVNLPSASIVELLRQEFAGRQPAPKAVAVLADPVFDLSDARVKRGPNPPTRLTSRSNSQPPIRAKFSSRAIPSDSTSPVKGEVHAFDLQRLLFSRDEADAILSLAPPKSSFKALDFQANRTLAMGNELSQYRIVHFSTHGLLDSGHPELSGLVFSLVDEKGRPEEGYLRLHEIYGLHLNADLVVLSACQTALGKDVRGEGLVGLTRGFMYAGAPRVVASLWEVDDAATAELMKRFYRGMLQDKLPPAAALRAAQIEMLQKKHWQAPYFWGAFVLQGEWR